MSTSTYERRGGRHRRRPQPVPNQFDQLATGLADAVERLVRAFDPAAQRPGLADLFANTPETNDRRRRGCRDCGRAECRGQCCDDRCPPPCEPCDCHCTCCIGDVDVVVYARAGETRVIPIQLENHRKRERNITVRLAEFRTKGGGDTGVVGALIGPTSFTLGPCSQREVVVVVRADFKDRDSKTATSTSPDLGGLTKAELLEQARRVGAEVTSAMSKSDLIGAIDGMIDIHATAPNATSTIDRPLPDVDDCHVAVADLCIEGCDSRPIRIAVAVLPRDCNSYDVHCDCACC